MKLGFVVLVGMVISWFVFFLGSVCPEFFFSVAPPIDGWLWFPCLVCHCVKGINYSFPHLKIGDIIHQTQAAISSQDTTKFYLENLTQQILLGEPNSISEHVQANWEHLYPHPNHSIFTSLQLPFLEEETVSFSLGTDKAPGPDGFSALLFQRYWHLVCRDLLDLFHSFYNNNIDMLRLNLAYITLISKKGAYEPNDFKPISLLNIPYKIITKVLSNRLRTHCWTTCWSLPDCHPQTKIYIR